MRLHTDILTPADIVAAVRAVPGVSLNGVDRAGWYVPLPEHGSRSRRRAFELRLQSDGTPDQHGASRRHRVNAGTADVDRSALPYAASYADWGHVLAALFARDPRAIAGPYKGADDFAAQTHGAFPLPELTA